MVTLFNGADIKVEVANFFVAMDTLIDQDGIDVVLPIASPSHFIVLLMFITFYFLIIVNLFS